MTQEIEVTVSPTGAVRLVTKCYTGASCREASQFLERALSVRGQETLTPEFHQSQETSSVTTLRHA